MDPDDIVCFSKNTIGYLENDKKTFEHVLVSEHCPGKIGFAMIAAAMAAFDAYAWLLFQKFDQRKTHKALFNQLLNDSRFFDKSKYGNENAFYSQIRCGVVHQLYPKKAMISAQNSTQVLYQHNGTLCINSFALFCDVLDGIKKIHSYIGSLSSDEKLDLSLKLLMRAKIDEETADNCSIDTSSLPPLT